MKEKTLIRLKRFSAVALLAITFTTMGILFASKMEWTDETRADGDEKVTEALKTTGLITSAGESPFVAVAQKAMPSVVNITAKKERRGSTRDLFDFGPFRDFFPDMHPDVPRGVTSGGSGIIIDEDGYILTNNHVVENATDIKVKDAEGHEYKAEIVGTDPQTDVALIRIKGAHFNKDHVAELGDSETLKVGDWAIAIGNPYGLELTVTVGVISAKGRSNLAISGGGPIYQNFIQTDASINFGNSGGPLINIKGEVIGVNTAINARGQGIGFAIPINLARKIYTQLRSDGQVVRGYLGMVPSELDDATREALGLDREVQGVFVDMVEEATPADDGGLEPGDVITFVDDIAVNDPAAFRFLIADRKPDSKMSLVILRDGRKKQLNFKLGNRADYVQAASTTNEEPENVWLGLNVESLGSPRARQLNLDIEEGVLVLAVDFESPAEGKIFPQDVIIEINREAIKNLQDYRKVASKLADKKDAILFRVIRNGRPTYEAVKP